MAETIVTLSGDDKALFQALQRIVGQQDKLDAGFKKIKATSKDASDAVAGGFKLDEAIVSVGKYVTAFALVEGAVQVVSAAFTEMIKKQERSLALSNENAIAQAGASKNLSGLTNEQKVIAFNDIREISKGGIDESILTEAYAAGFGVANDTAKTTLALMASSKLALLSPMEVKDLTKGSLSVQRSTGVSSPEEALGFIQTSAGNAFIESNSLVADRMTPVIGSALPEVPGQNKQEAAIDVAGLFTEVSKLIQDKTGDVSKTITDKFFRSLDVVFDSGEFLDPGTLRGRELAAQTNPEIKAAVLKEFGDNEGTGAIKQLLDASSNAAKALQDSRKSISFNRRVYDEEVISQQSLTPDIAIAGQGRC
jgi:hypothetical protein